MKALYALLLSLFIIITGCGSDRAAGDAMRGKYLINITVYDPDIPGERVLRVCTGPDGYTTGPSDATPHVTYQPRVKSPGYYRRDCFAPGTTTGQSTIGKGEVTLSNLDGALDGWKRYGFDGRRISIVYMDPTGAIVPVQVATMTPPSISTREVVIKLRDRLEELKKPLQPIKYLGNNESPNGVEGGVNLKGQPKPVLIGRPGNITPRLVNASKQIYQYHDSAAELYRVRNGDGVEVPADHLVGTPGTATPYATLADMMATAPAAGTYRCYISSTGSYVRLGFTPQDPVTCDPNEGNSFNGTLPDDLIYTPAPTLGMAIKTAVLRAGLSVDDVVQADLDAVDVRYPSRVGIYASEERNCLSVIEELAPAGRLWFGFDNVGKFRVQIIDAPTGDPALTVTDYLELEALPTEMVPVSRVNLNFRRNYTVQETGVAGIVDVELRERLAREWTTVTAPGSTSPKHLLGEEMNIFTPLVSQGFFPDWPYTLSSQVQDLCDDYAAVYGGESERLRVRIKLSGVWMFEAIDLGKVVQIKVPRLGYGTGALFAIIGYQPDLETKRVELMLWRPVAE